MRADLAVEELDVDNYEVLDANAARYGRDAVKLLVVILLALLVGFTLVAIVVTHLVALVFWLLTLGRT